MQGGSSRTSQRPTTANQTKQTLTCCGQFGGMEGQGQRGFVSGEGVRRLHP